MSGDVLVYDTTLRDGAQQEGMNLSVADKLTLLPMLEAYGADIIEGGWPGAIPRDTEFFREIAATQPLTRARLAAFGATRKAGVDVEDDQQVAALLASEAPIITLVAKSDARHVAKALRTTEEENLRMVRDTVAYLVEQGREVMVDLEHFFDGADYDRDYTFAVAVEAVRAGASTVIACDTNGGALPDGILARVGELSALLDEEGLTATIGIHAHNDGEMAVANTLAAVTAGAAHIQGTVNGYGERTGNANILTAIANLHLKMGRKVVTDDQLADLSRVSHAVAEIVNIAPYRRQPYTGVSAFAHKAGLHASAIRVDADLYQHIDPARVGNDMRMIVSDMAGRASIELKARELGLDLSDRPDVLSEVTRRIKEAEALGYTYDATDASVELLIREVAFGERLSYFDIESWTTHLSGSSEGSHGAEAVVKLSTGAGRSVTVGEGVGPVDALDQALRGGLCSVYPELEDCELIDFKVRILDPSAATRATTRVIISMSSPAGIWATVGLGRDIIEASWEALTDGYIYGLFKAGVPVR
ncbi:citramalate synthase [Flaviflexus salsibiostraticola]|uniref:Citramalate synthase n=1 Tax=Flaviflexus salsibiostraticola TaxID=1282737 RepID=A0A3S8Z8P5_9ACTO|nr:citramalate synthase [Flaviflexus salsibiostraticola]AZN29814.1 citramalate synthase [Flaviflexus salsibiostraticola]